MSIKVENKIYCYEIDGIETKGLDRPEILIKNHWCRSNMVIINIEGKTYTVLAQDLITAINNSTNANH
jgi:hypothetical protein